MDNNKTIVIQAKPSSTAVEENNDLNALKEFFYVCLEGWKWFVLSLVVFTACAFLYLKISEPMYTRSASVHIKEDSRKGSIGNISDEFSALGIGNTSMSANNEVVAINSLELAEQVVRQMNLNVSYKTDDGMRKKVLFGETQPIKVTFIDIEDEDEISFTVDMLEHGKYRISDFKYNNEYFYFEKESSFGTKVSTPAGGIIIYQSKNRIIEEPKSHKIHVSRIPLSEATEMLHNKLVAVQNNNKNSVIDITYEDANIERAEAVINTLIVEYNKNWIKDKNELGVLTSQFIDERIHAIQQELGGVDTDIAKYKSENLIAAPDQATGMLLSQASQSDQQIMTLTGQIAMCRYLSDYIAAKEHSHKLIPANVGIQSADVTALVATYNQQMLQRNTYADNSSEKNPLVLNLDVELQAQRSAIMQSLANVRKDLEAQMQASTKTMRQSTSKLSVTPVQEKNLLSMDRQQKVKEALYLFLLQKREENELSQAFSAYNTRIISRPMGSNLPTSPVPLRIYLVALISAFILPVIVLYIRELFNTQVRGRKDIEKLPAPFVGEIPEYKGINTDGLVVQQANRNIINEAFRIVRSNLSFMLHPNKAEHRKVVLVTSANPGSGKTFVALNLASVCSFSQNTRVALVDMDIRKCSLSKLAGKSGNIDPKLLKHGTLEPLLGVSDYLGGFEDDWHKLLLKINDDVNVDILPVGHIPPNPSELLQSDRLSVLLQEMKQEYDIIFLDMPPAEAVADVSIVKHLADLTLYVIRTGHMNRTMLPIIERYYQEKTFNNLAIILNGSQFHRHRYGYGRYGYGYYEYTKQ